MQTSMKIDAFKVYSHKSPSLKVVLEKMHKTGNGCLELISRAIDNKIIRFEAIEKVTSGETALWLIDFGVLTNSSGPGKASPSTPIEPFDFEDGEQFGEDTAVLYDPETESILIQYNHQGVKANGIRDYASQFDQTATYAYALHPILRSADFDNVMEDKPYVKKVEIAVDTRTMEITDKDSISSVIGAFQEKKEDSYITISVSARGGRSSEVPSGTKVVFETFKSLMQLGKADVKTLRKSVSDGESAQEILDFIEVRLSKREDVKVSKGYRLARNDRWNALIRAYNEWKKDGELD